MKVVFLLMILLANCLVVYAAEPFSLLQRGGFSNEFKAELRMRDFFNNVLMQKSGQSDAERRAITVQGKQTNWGVKAPILGAVFLGSSAFVYLGYKNNQDAGRMYTEYNLSKDPEEILVLREAIESKEDYRNLYYGLGVFGFASFTIIFVAF